MSRWSLIRFSGYAFFFFAMALFAAVLSSVANVLSGDALARIIDQIVAQDKNGLVRVGLWSLGILVLSVLSVFFQKYFSGHFAERVTARLREQASLSLAQAKVSAMSAHHSGDLISRLSNDIGLYQEYLQTDLPALLSGVLSALLALAYMFYRNWLLSLLLLATLPVIIIVSTLLSQPLSKRQEEVQQSLARINAQAKENVTGAETIRALSLKNILRERFNPVEARWFRSSIRAGHQSVLLTVAGITLSFLPFLVVFGFGGLQVLRGEISVGMLFAFIQLLNLIAFPLQELPVYLGKVKAGAVGGKRVRELLDVQKEPEAGVSANVAAKPQILFENVTFSYPGQKTPCLKALSFRIDPGEKVAFVGSSGSGKSTVLKMIAGDHFPDEGRLLVGGLPTTEWSLPELRNKMGIVTQETFLFDTSIEENVRLGKADAEKEEVERVLGMTKMDAFTDRLPEKSLTTVGELGGRISGGQKQRLCLSRAMIRKAPILVFDEATSALDNKTERQILASIRSEYPESTLMMVAHRMNAVTFADKIFVLENGEILEEGTHLTLMQKNGRYAALMRMQTEEEPQ